MSELFVPEVVQRLQPEQMSALGQIANQGIMDANFTPEQAREVLAEMAETVGSSLAELSQVEVTKRVIAPGSQLLAPETAYWHTDYTFDLFASDKWPTQFLIGDAEALARCLQDESILDLDLSNTRVVFDICEMLVIRRITDKQLRASGLDIWSPKPLDVVTNDEPGVHRGRVNHSNKPTTRTLVAHYKSGTGSSSL